MRTQLKYLSWPIMLLMIVGLFATSFLALPSAQAVAPADPYADEVDADTSAAPSVIDPINAVGAPNATLADVTSIDPDAILSLDLGEDEEGAGELIIHYGDVLSQITINVDLYDADSNQVSTQQVVLEESVDGQGDPIIKQVTMPYADASKPYRYVVFHAHPVEDYSIDAVQSPNYGPDADFDGMPNSYELANSLNPLLDDTLADADNDGLNNITEFTIGTDPQDNDSDNDTLLDGFEVNGSLDPLSAATPNGATDDKDADGLTNAEEQTAGTNPSSDDSDADTLKDKWELDNGLNPLSATGADGAQGDPDSDNLNNAAEQTAGTDPQDNDSDNDTLLDGFEVNGGLNPLSALSPNGAPHDKDNDGLTNAEEQTAGTNPSSDDSDADTLKDKWELDNGLNPVSATGADGAQGDPDTDGLSNAGEQTAGTDPQDNDSDNDTLPDGWEVNYQLNPLSDVGDDGATGDPDRDRINNAAEYARGSNPRVADVGLVYIPIARR